MTFPKIITRFVDAYMRIDLASKYKVTDSMEVKFEAVNMGGEEEYYTGAMSCSRLNKTSSEEITQ